MKIGSLDSEDGLLLAKEKFEDSETARTDPELNIKRKLHIHQAYSNRSCSVLLTNATTLQMLLNMRSSKTPSIFI